VCRNPHEIHEKKSSTAAKRYLRFFFIFGGDPSKPRATFIVPEISGEWVMSKIHRNRRKKATFNSDRLAIAFLVFVLLGTGLYKAVYWLFS
jgi:hypothetical protein